MIREDVMDNKLISFVEALVLSALLYLISSVVSLDLSPEGIEQAKSSNPLEWLLAAMIIIAIIWLSKLTVTAWITALKQLMAADK